MTQNDTKGLILDAAERLFAEHGFDATSLRTITTTAGVNLAAIHYHYGSKEALIEAVLVRRLSDVNGERLQLLDTAGRAAGDRPLDLEAVLHAFVAPAFHAAGDPGRGGERFVRLVGMAHSLPGSHLIRIFKKHFQPVIERFSQAFSQALPELPIGELYWNMHFMIGAMAHTMMKGKLLEEAAGGLIDASDQEAVVDRLVAFAAAGMRAAARRQLERPA
jgi:AcrR family transcriptional regulator